ncbi:hypothetical protein PCL_01925 [Purpureocillium lilacinum]|uniref:Uncharacterized protein n=1 Tax=Purpureocillium lilacinum TaxID=33203 RepID=A0A2U3DNX5_PURLI|nr:hypothetical protein PCL_01925 [Purpureocillium lilacinum]
MSSPKIPPEHVYCVQAGKKYQDLFTTIYVDANYCGRCGLANPFRTQRRARSKTPALPGPYDEVVEVEDSPPRPLIPGGLFVPGAVTSRARVLSSDALLLVSLEARYFNGLSVEIPETVLPLKDTVIKFSSADLLTWPSFTDILFDHLRPLPDTIDPTNKDLWSILYASSFSGKKIAGQLKVLVVLTSTEVVDKQEPVTPLRPEEYSTPTKDNKKRKMKQEDSSLASERKKRLKRGARVKREGGNVGDDQVKQEIHVKIEEERAATAPCRSPMLERLEDTWNVLTEDTVVDLSGAGDSDCDSELANVEEGRDCAGESELREVDEDDCEEGTYLAPEFVTYQPLSLASMAGDTQASDGNESSHPPPAHSTRFRGRKTPATYAVRYRKRTR